MPAPRERARTVSRLKTVQCSAAQGRVSGVHIQAEQLFFDNYTDTKYGIPTAHKVLVDCAKRGPSEFTNRRG